MPIDHPLVLLGVAIRPGRRERTPFKVLVVLAAMTAAFAEPSYDTAMQLCFYLGEGMYTHFTAFDIPQPVWTHSGYAVLYAAPALAIAHKIRQGTLTRNGLFAWACVELMRSCTFEMVGINVLRARATVLSGPLRHVVTGVGTRHATSLAARTPPRWPPASQATVASVKPSA